MKKFRPNSKGIIYVAFGYEYLLMAANSAFTAKKFNPEVACSVITNVKINDKNLLKEYFDEIYYEDSKNELNRFYKTRALDYASFARGAFLDCDTEVQGDLAPALACLEKYDIILKMTPRPSIKDYRISREIHGSEFPMWNSGVIFFNNDEPAKRLFSSWAELFKEMEGRSDQPALARAVFENAEVRLLSVNYMWNAFPSDLILAKTGHEPRVRIWHYRNPHEFPEVARRIFQHHQAVTRALDLTDIEARKEIDKTEKKYKILCSGFYQSGLLRPFYLRCLKIIGKLGMGPRPELSRTKKRTGSRYKNFD